MLVLGRIGAIFALFSNTIWGSLRYRKTRKFALKLDPKRIRYTKIYILYEMYNDDKFYKPNFLML